MGGAVGGWRVWLCATLMVAAGVVGAFTSRTPVADAQATYEVSPLGTDAERKVDRYRVTIASGASFYEVAVNHLPLLALEEGDAKAIEVIEQAWSGQYPDRAAGTLRPGDSFVFEVPTGQFVSRTYSRQDDRLTYTSFSGDELTTFPRDPVVQYRLRRADDPNRAEVLIHGGQAGAVDEARRAFDVEDPDFLQVRTIRAVVQERVTKLSVDLTRKYLDDFRVYRDRAVRVEDLPDRLKAYTFNQDDEEIPFVRIEDGVGNETDPGNFPRLFRVAYYRDGTVRRYLVTESGDSLAALTRPDSAAWSRVLPAWKEWQPGQAEALPPFTPALNAAGVLLPGRILVVAFRPRTIQVTPRPTRTTSSSGVDCLGVPLGLLLAGGVWMHHRRVPIRPDRECALSAPHSPADAVPRR